MSRKKKDRKNEIDPASLPPVARSGRTCRSCGRPLDDNTIAGCAVCDPHNRTGH